VEKALSGGKALYNFAQDRPKVGQLAGIPTCYLGDSDLGIEIAAKYRVTDYYRDTAGIDRLRRLMALLRTKKINCTLVALNAGLGSPGCAIFALNAPKVRKLVLKFTQQEIDHTAQL
jgi:hypothetical protein